MTTKPVTKTITLRSPKNVLWNELRKAHDHIESAEALLGEYRTNRDQHKQMEAVYGKLIANFETICANYQKLVGQMAHRLSEHGIDPGLGAVFEELKVVIAKPEPEPVHKLRVIEGAPSDA